MKAWLVYGSNLIQSLPEPQRTIEAIQKLDFICAIDVLPSEICGWADVVLPECTYLERWDDLWAAPYEQPFVALRQPAVEPRFDSKPGWWIAKELGRRLGLEPFFPWKDAREAVETRAKAAKLDWAALLAKGVVLGPRTPVCEEEGLALGELKTESKKIELASASLGKLGFDALPTFYPPEEPPPGSFRMLSGRSPVHTFGRTTNNRFLGEVVAENEVWINADAARALPFEPPLRSGEKVVLVNQDGVRSTPVAAKLTERIRGDCVWLAQGFGHTASGLRFARGRGASTSALTTRSKTDPLMGGTALNLVFVRLERPEGRAS